MRKLLILPLLLLLFSCMSTQVTMTGKPGNARMPSGVKIIFNDKPNCKYEELGFISTPLMWNQTYAIEEARRQAAAIGANYLSIQTVQKNEWNDAQVSAIAYICGNVDRNIDELDKPEN
jgi:hypothetical protein